MRKSMVIAATAAAVLATPALAGSSEGRWQVKLLATGVLPDGKITKVKADALGLPPGSQTGANDNVVPSAAIEYFVSPALSVETICCLTQHHVNGAGAIAGTSIVDHVLILPATLTVKYHLNAGSIRPYVGAGPSMFFIFGEKPGATARALGATKARMSERLGVALQVGADIPINDKGLGITVDAKKYFIGTTLHVEASGAEVLTTRHKLNPWVLSAGLSYRF